MKELAHLLSCIFFVISLDSKVISCNLLLFETAYKILEAHTVLGKEFADVSTCLSVTSNMCLFAAVIDTKLKLSLSTILYPSYRRYEPLHIVFRCRYRL